MSDKIEQAAEVRKIVEAAKGHSRHAENFGSKEGAYLEGVKYGAATVQSTITTLQAENIRLKGALGKIAEGCSPKDPISDLTYSEIKELATEALTPKE
jgi:hypothetical protein